MYMKDCYENMHVLLDAINYSEYNKRPFLQKVHTVQGMEATRSKGLEAIYIDRKGM